MLARYFINVVFICFATTQHKRQQQGQSVAPHRILDVDTPRVFCLGINTLPLQEQTINAHHLLLLNYHNMPCECLASIAFCPCLCIYPCFNLWDICIIPHCLPALPCLPLFPCCAPCCCPMMVDGGGKSSASGVPLSTLGGKYMPVDHTTTFKLD